MTKPAPPVPPVPASPTLPRLRASVQECRACELWRDATQAVLGEGPVSARLMLVGETPGDREDLAGKVFVGPAGRVLDRALEEVGVDRTEAYLTNAVKHFRYRSRGKRRIHQTPEASQIAACRPWVEAELAVVRPRVLVCLGAVAARSLLGRDVRVTRDRGREIESDLANHVLVTVHPSSLLRAPDSEARHAAYAAFVHDLRAAVGLLD